jgi:putative ABC transport system permease protein
MMAAGDLLRFAAAALRGHRLRTLFSLLGVAIGVASVITLTSLGEGARLYITGEFTSLGTNLLILLPGKTETFGGAPMVSTAPNDLTVADAEAVLRRVPQVTKVAPVALGSASASYGDLSRGIMVVGTTLELLEVRRLRMASGRYLPRDEPDAPVCVLGAKVATELFGLDNPLGRVIRLGDSRFRVIGVMAPRGMSIGWDMDEVVHVPVDAGMRLFNRTSLFRLICQVREHGAIDAAREAALAVLRERHGGVDDVTALTQDAVLQTFDRIFRALTVALAGIAAISLAVAGIGIMNVMLVSVSERTREVGLLKAVGVTRAQIVAVFLMEAALISTGGGVLGLAGGYGMGGALRRLVPDLPATPPSWAVLAALAVSVSVGLLFGSLPARRAAGLDPVAALMRSRA